jgi:hypothetical protein
VFAFDVVFLVVSVISLSLTLYMGTLMHDGHVELGARPTFIFLEWLEHQFLDIYMLGWWVGFKWSLGMTLKLHFTASPMR